MPGVEKNPIFSERLVERLKELGYWNIENDRADVSKFCRENPYLSSNVHRWLDGEVPSAETLMMLARRLGLTRPGS